LLLRIQKRVLRLLAGPHQTAIARVRRDPQGVGPVSPARGAQIATRVGIMVVDRRRGFASMLGALLEDEIDLACVGVAATVAEALDLIEVQHTDLLVLGAHPEEAVAAARALKKQQPDIGVIVVTANGEPAAVERFARAGVAGVITDTRAPADILAAIKRVARGRDGSSVPAVDGGDDHTEPQSVLTEDSRTKLTKRELDVLNLMGDAVPPKQIAAQLRISVHTCRDHIRSIQGKLGCHSALQVVLEAQHRGLLPKPE
jgi:DNA-binding NarL/FixJ family response regulator